MYKTSMDYKPVSQEPIIPEPIVQSRPKGEKRRGNKSLWLFVGLALTALLVVPFLVLRPRTQTYTLRSYETATVQVGTLVDYVRGSGTVSPKLERSVVAGAEGVVTEWLVAEGDEVEAGATLGTMSSKDLGQDLADAQKEVQAAQLAIEKLRLEQGTQNRALTLELERAQTDLNQATAELTTTQKLFGAGAASQNELDTATLEVTQSQEDVTSKSLALTDAATADTLALQEAQLGLERSQSKLAAVQEQETALTLTAPVTGRVMKLSVAVGESVQAGSLLASVASSEDVRVVVKIPESQANRVGVGQVAQLSVGNTDYPASVVGVSPNAESAQNGPQVAVTLAFDEVPAALRIGASATAEIEVGRKEDALYLPRGAYLSTGGERFVYRVSGDSAERVNVTFGLVDGNNIEIKDGLGSGGRIVSSSYEAFKDKPSINLAPEGNITR